MLRSHITRRPDRRSRHARPRRLGRWRCRALRAATTTARLLRQLIANRHEHWRLFLR